MDIAVVGSINRDITVMTSRLPEPGETLLGNSHHTGGGGKGANQAVAAARLGSGVAMVGRVGDDDHGHALLDALVTEGVDISGVGLDPILPTGLALITVDEHAENTIVVSPGANAALSPQHIPEPLVGGVRVLLAQLEIPMETVASAASMCSGLFLLNPAPAAPLSAELLEQVDVLIPNRSELATLSSVDEPTDVSEAISAVRRLHRSGPTVVTLGAKGALIVEGAEAHHVPAAVVDAIDPTGAGDAFCGALADSLARGRRLETAVERAVMAGGIATTRRGAQTAMPNDQELAAFLDTIS